MILKVITTTPADPGFRGDGQEGFGDSEGGGEAEGCGCEEGGMLLHDIVNIHTLIL